MSRAGDIEIEIPTRALAFDRRTVDADGRMTIENCVISAAQCNPYLGREIPDYELLRLEPERIYTLYRDADALRAAVPLFNGMPLLDEHAGVSSIDPKQNLVVGAVRDARWDSGRVVGTLTVWHADAIRGIETNAQRDLSAGYRYKPEMISGVTAGGERYDGRMLDIAPNHVA